MLQAFHCEKMHGLKFGVFLGLEIAPLLTVLYEQLLTQKDNEVYMKVH